MDVRPAVWRLMLSKLFRRNVVCIYAILATVCVATTHAASDRVFVGVRVNGVPMRFGLDTGAGIGSVMWRDVADMLALRTMPAAPGAALGTGQVRAGLSEPVAFDFWGSSSRNAQIAVVDAPAFAKWQIQGIVGWEGVRDNVWLFDFGHGDIHDLAQLPDVKDWFRYPLLKNAPTLAIEVPRTGEAPGVIAIDTGSGDDVAISPELWKQWRAAHPDGPMTYDETFMLAPGYLTLGVTAAAEWSIDRLTLKYLLLSQANPTDIAEYGPNYLATFGLGALRQFVVIVDARNGFAYFRPSGVVRPAPPYNRLGAVFHPRDAGAKEWVAKVLSGSPAAVAGIQNGDVLTGIDGLPIAHWQQRPCGWPPHDQFVRPAGTPVDLELRRDHKRVTAHPILQDVLQGVPSVAEHAREADVPDFHFLPPLAAVVRKADGLNLPVRKFDLTFDTGTIQKDDKVTTLVTVADDDGLQQWLVLIVGTELKPAERTPGKPFHIYTSSGRDFTLQSIPTGVAIRSIGPFTQGKSADPDDVWSGAILDRESLGVGFDSVSTTVQKIVSAKVGANFGTRTEAFAGPDVAENKRRLEAAGIGADDERAFIVGGAALSQFFRIAAQTPGVRNVLRRLLDLSWKDYLRHTNVHIDFRPLFDSASADWWGLPPSLPCRTVAFRVDINGTPRLICRVAATPPVRPLQTVAGIVGLAAARIDGSGPHIMVRVLGGSLGNEKSAP